MQQLCNMCAVILAPEETPPYCAKCAARPFARWALNGLVFALFIACLIAIAILIAHSSLHPAAEHGAFDGIGP
jgi:hypothetical protein